MAKEVANDVLRTSPAWGTIASARLNRECCNFWALLVRGRIGGELGRGTVVLFAVTWAAVEMGLLHIARFGAMFVTPAIAVLDIALVFIVLGGDVRIG